MPPAEVVVTPALVRSLLSDQRPDLADRDISLLAHGWDNETFRVGDDLVARMPRRDMAAGLVENEARWLPLLASRLTVPVSAPSFLGEPGHGYPWRWVLVPWIPGESAALSEIDHDHVAVALAEFLRCLHVPAPAEHDVGPTAPEDPQGGEWGRQRPPRGTHLREAGLAGEPGDAERVELEAGLRNQPRLDALARPCERHRHPALPQRFRDGEGEPDVTRRPAGCDQAHELGRPGHSPRC